MGKSILAAAMTFVFAGALSSAYALDNNAKAQDKTAKVVAKADAAARAKHRGHGKKTAPVQAKEETKTN